MKYISDFCYYMDMSIGGDVWRCTGIVNGNQVWTSLPKAYDKENKILTTQNSIYQITNFAGKIEDIEAQLEKDIANKGFEIH